MNNIGHQRIAYSRKKLNRRVKDTIFSKLPPEILDLWLYPLKFRRKQAFTPENSASFLINHWHFHMLFLQYPWKFHFLNPTLCFFSGIAQSTYILLVDDHHVSIHLCNFNKQTSPNKPLGKLIQEIVSPEVSKLNQVETKKKSKEIICSFLRKKSLEKGKWVHSFIHSCQLIIAVDGVIDSSITIIFFIFLKMFILQQRKNIGAEMR